MGVGDQLLGQPAQPSEDHPDHDHEGFGQEEGELEDRPEHSQENRYAQRFVEEYVIEHIGICPLPSTM
jgi:hypothetical protein